jgi:hypothetical protein
MQRYISSELTHFVGRGRSKDDQYELLSSILSDGLLSHPPHRRNWSGNLSVKFDAKISKNEMFNPEVVCFCDIPYADLPLHMKKYSHFGIAFKKEFIVGHGGSPVYYIPIISKIRISKQTTFSGIAAIINSGGTPEIEFDTITLGDHFDAMLKEYQSLMLMCQSLVSKTTTSLAIATDLSRLTELDMFLSFRVFSYIKFFDPTLADDHQDNFYFEREWRVVGNVEFSLEDVVRIIIPKEFAERFRDDFPKYYGELIFAE